MMALLNPKVWLAMALAAVLAFTHTLAWRNGSAHTQARWDAAKVVQQQAVDDQAQRNRELQRAAEKRYVVQAQTRDHFIVTTVKEFINATPSLAACPVGPAGVGVLNRAAQCARSDSPSACGADLPVPATR